MKTIFIIDWFDRVTTRAGIKLRRYRRALAYARYTLTREQALDLLYDAQDAAECWSLDTIDTEGVLIAAREMWEDHPQFPALAEEAASRVASKWCGDGHVTDIAHDWALDLFREYAAQEGVALIEKE